MEPQGANWESIVGDQDWDTYCRFSSQERHAKIAQLQQILENVSSNTQQAEIWRQIGRLWSAEGRCVDAIEAHENALVSFERAIALQPDFHEAWNNRGNSLVDLDKCEEAIAAFDAALQLKPDYYQAWTNRGNAFYHFSRYEEAIASKIFRA